MTPRRTSNVRQSQRMKLYERSQKECEAALPGCFRFANNAHHRKNASQGGSDELSNLLCLCGSGTVGCHGWITGNPGEAKRMGLSVWPSDDPSLTPVMYRGHWALLRSNGEVTLLKRGQVQYDLGHLSVQYH